MKGLGLLIFKIMLVALAILSILYFLDVPVTDVAGEPVGFADLVNFFLLQQPPNLEKHGASASPEMSDFASRLDGAELGESAGMLAGIGNPVEFCVFRDYNYCQTFRIEGGRMEKTSEAPQKTVYLSYALATELRTRVEANNFEGLQKRLVQGLKSGEVKGLTLTDVMSIGQ